MLVKSKGKPYLSGSLEGQEDHCKVAGAEVLLDKGEVESSS